ncbi:MAG: 3-phosphoshikimate 1-carboxyvinyltransferase [Capsulimonadaceae bacterium]|nr:3-phosphoshikimate 1-carboxyvinyltransferase [Capsulimonadaceae bacterium]
MGNFTYPPAMTFTPLRNAAHATVTLPGSKSITNRALLIASLAGGRSILSGALDADDTRRMIECLGALGVSIEKDGETLTVHGTGGRYSAPQGPLFAGNSGTTIRFLTTAAPFTPAGSNVILDGNERMRQRPIADLVEAMTQLGVDVRCLGDGGCPPVRVAGGGLRGGRCSVHGTISSQYLSALLMAAPLATSDTHIVVEGSLVSKPYVDLTDAVMTAFGVAIGHEEYQKFAVPGRLHYIARDYAIEPDASNATYFLAAAALTGGRVTVSGLGSSSAQGDATFVRVLEEMGCAVMQGQSTTVVTGPDTLHAVDIDLESIPDTAQTVAVLALFANGVSRLRGLGTLRVKETDRIEALATEMRKLGAEIVAGPDSLTITPPKSPYTAAIDTYDDHRMAMSFAVATLRLPSMTINDPGCVAKTFPDFWHRWQAAFGNVAQTVL